MQKKTSTMLNHALDHMHHRIAGETHFRPLQSKNDEFHGIKAHKLQYLFRSIR